MILTFAMFIGPISTAKNVFRSPEWMFRILSTKNRKKYES